jgi:hypothetical protein
MAAARAGKIGRMLVARHMPNADEKSRELTSRFIQTA